MLSLCVYYDLYGERSIQKMWEWVGVCRARERERELPTLRKLIMLKFTLLAAVDVNRWNRLAQLFLDSALRIVNLCRRRRRRRHVTHNQNLKWSTAINARQCGELSIIVARRFTVVILVLPYALLNEKKPCFVFLLLTLSTPHYCSLYPRPPSPTPPPHHPVAHFTPTWPIRLITKEASRVVFSFLLQRKRISNCHSLPPSFYTKSHSSNNSSSINNDDNLCNTFLFLPFLSPFASYLPTECYLRSNPFLVMQ